MANLSNKSGKFLLLISSAALLLASCSESVAPIYEGSPVSVVATSSLSDLENTFHLHQYDINKLQQGVPPIIFQSLPADLSDIRSTKRRKKLFFQTLLPMVLLANEEITLERELLIDILSIVAQGHTLDEERLHILTTLQERYMVEGVPTAPETLETLKRRIDLIPPELALAQAANESAWGTSRFSQLGNNLYGEWTFIPGTGIIPEGRPEGETYEVRRFETLYDSIRSYLRNLNTHSAYSDFRVMRAEAKDRGETLSGVKLAKGLMQYSTRREDYVLDLQRLIRQNNLQRFSQVSLRQG